MRNEIPTNERCYSAETAMENRYITIQMKISETTVRGSKIPLVTG